MKLNIDGVVSMHNGLMGRGGMVGNHLDKVMGIIRVKNISSMSPR